MHRFSKLFFLYIVATLFLSVSLSAEEEAVTLAYRYTPGQVLHYRHELVLEIRREDGRGPSKEFATAGTPQTLTTDIVSRVTQEVKSVESDGSVWVDVRYDAFDVSQKLNGVEVPTGGDHPKSPYHDLIGKTISMRMQPDGKLLEVAEASDGASNPFLRQTVSQFQQVYGQTEGVFPDHPIRVGESWTKTLELPLPGLRQKGTVEFQNTFESFEKVGDRNCVKIKSDLRFSLPEGALRPEGVPEGVGKTLGLSVTVDGKGTIYQYFDPSVGVMVKGEGKTTLRSTQSITIPATETEASKTSESHSTIQVSFKTELE